MDDKESKPVRMEFAADDYATRDVSPLLSLLILLSTAFVSTIFRLHEYNTLW